MGGDFCLVIWQRSPPGAGRLDAGLWPGCPDAGWPLNASQMCVLLLLPSPPQPHRPPNFGAGMRRVVRTWSLGSR